MDPEEKSQEEPSGQSRAPVLTVVSKFKVGPGGADRMCLIHSSISNIYQAPPRIGGLLGNVDK